MATHDVFISYSSLDKAAADAVCHGLEADGVRCWMAPRDVTPGMDWQQSLLEAIAASKAVVLVFTQNANDSPNVRKEVTAAFEGGAVVVPFRLEAVEPQGSLRYHLTGVHWLDALTPPLEANVRQLATNLKRLLGSLNAEGGDASGRRPEAPAPQAFVSPPASTPAAPPPPAAPDPTARPTYAKPPGPPPWLLVAGATIALVGGCTWLIMAIPSAPTEGTGDTPAVEPEKPPEGQPAAPTSTNVAPPPVVAGSPGRAEALNLLRTASAGPTFAGESDPGAGSTALTTAGAATVSTAQLVQALANHLAEITLVDAIGCMDGHDSVPTAYCLAPDQDPGPALRQAGVDADRPLVFFCHGPSCTWSQTMATRAAAGGYRNVFWYRGGLAAWNEAGGPTQPPRPLIGG